MIYVPRIEKLSLWKMKDLNQISASSKRFHKNVIRTKIITGENK